MGEEHVHWASENTWHSINVNKNHGHKVANFSALWDDF